MASAVEISGQVDLLADAYGRQLRDGSLVYDAYHLALSDVEIAYIRRGVTALLRDRLQFMPTPAEVRAHAKAAQDYERQRENVEDNRRLTCLRCEDRGYIRVFNRRWVAQFRDQFDDAWFVAGWMLEATDFCKQEWHEPFLLYVVCGCECRNSGIYERQIERWKEAKEDPSIKAPHPAYMNVFNPDYDPLFRRTSDPAKNLEQDCAEVLTEFAAADQRKWQGNWTP